MCGIVGYIGKNDKKEVILSGLKELEYRGYDSAGMAIFDGDLKYYKAVGKLNNLADKTKDLSLSGDGVAIGHTRWATHGKPTEINAHPHIGEYSFVIHNGIIENFSELKEELIANGAKFVSQTDTEVIVHLFEYFANSVATSALEAWQKTIAKLKGAFATLLITKKEPNAIFFAKHGAPLLIARSGDRETHFASSDTALIGICDTAAYLDDGSFGVANIKGDIKIFNAQNEPIKLSFTTLPEDKGYAQKDGFSFFMQKEIYEQSVIANDCLMGRINGDKIRLEVATELLKGASEVVLCACGSSYHAALVASYLIERVAKTRASVEIASEFRYKNGVMPANALFIVISQSGETADSLEALKIAKKSGAKTLCVCNVDNSSIVRLADSVILTRAGVEKGVASTKAFMAQTLCLWMLAVQMGELNGSLNAAELAAQISAIRSTPSALLIDESQHEHIKRISKHYLHGHGFFFIGRDIFYPLALEGALKLKEISYLHAEGYPAGEMKHGPIALADERLFCLALMPKNILSDKTRSNVEELAARDAFITAIGPDRFSLADDEIITQNRASEMEEFFEMMVVLQLFALEIAIRLGNDVDMPRNLAKSVTVE